MDPGCGSTVVVTAAVGCPASGNPTENDDSNAFLHRASADRRDTPTPLAGDGLFWLLRSAAACNEPGAGGSFSQVGEAVERTVEACPD